MKSIIDRLLNSNIFKTFTVESLPFIYQSEYYNIAWGKQHNGKYVDPLGRTFYYNNPKSWNSYKSEDSVKVDGNDPNGYINPEQLFQNLKQTTLGLTKYKIFRKENPITKEIAMDLLETKADDEGWNACDTGITTNLLLIYDENLKYYRRIILEAKGDWNLRNRNSIVSSIVNKLGTISQR